MSNSTNTIQFLRENENNFIRLRNIDTDTFFGHKQDIYLTDIPNDDLTNYVKNYSQGKSVRIEVEHRQQNGSTTRKSPNPTYKSYVIDIVVQSEEPKALPSVPVQNTPMMAQPMMAQPFLAAPGDYNNMLANPIVKGYLDANEKKYVDLKERYDELKEDFKDVRSKNRILEEDLSQHKTKLAISEKEKEMAILSEQMNKRSFWESEAFKTAMEKAPEMFATIAQAKMGVQPAAAPSLNAPKTSPVKQDVINFILNNLSDEETDFFGTVMSLMDNEAFVNELNTLVQNHVSAS